MSGIPISPIFKRKKEEETAYDSDEDLELTKIETNIHDDKKEIKKPEPKRKIIIDPINWNKNPDDIPKDLCNISYQRKTLKNLIENLSWVETIGRYRKHRDYNFTIYIACSNKIPFTYIHDGISYYFVIYNSYFDIKMRDQDYIKDIEKLQNIKENIYHDNIFCTNPKCNCKMKELEVFINNLNTVKRADEIILIESELENYKKYFDQQFKNDNIKFNDRYMDNFIDIFQEILQIEEEKEDPLYFRNEDYHIFGVDFDISYLQMRFKNIYIHDSPINQEDLYKLNKIVNYSWKNNDKINDLIFCKYMSTFRENFYVDLNDDLKSSLYNSNENNQEKILLNMINLKYHSYLSRPYITKKSKKQFDEGFQDSISDIKLTWYHNKTSFQFGLKTDDNYNDYKDYILWCKNGSPIIFTDSITKINYYFVKTIRNIDTKFEYTKEKDLYDGLHSCSFGRFVPCKQNFCKKKDYIISDIWYHNFRGQDIQYPKSENELYTIFYKKFKISESPFQKIQVFCPSPKAFTRKGDIVHTPVQSFSSL